MAMLRVRSTAKLLGLVSAAVLVNTAFAEEEAANTTLEYAAPEVPGLHWAETFDGDVWSRWSHSKQEKYTGKFTVEKRKLEALVGDVGLVVPEEAKHYGISSTFSPIVGKKEVPFVVQYEVKLQDGLSCGGAYMKLFDSHGVDGKLEEFKDDTRFVIMFGPDRCGATDKVHFILQHRSPKTGVCQEKHFKDTPSVPKDNLSHLYGLIINPDNSFEIHIDGEKKASGNLMSSMEPHINPLKDIDDPADKKPENWVDEAKMDDPTSSKPDVWDEDAPMMIPDAKVSKPEGWVDDAPKKLADPSAKKPDDWDDDEDGEWEAPMVDNPACKIGCGTWEAPKISNPEYKGKWHAPKIDNPEYKGVWRPRQIPNPDYFFDESPAILPTIDSVGIDIWTMSKGIMFDNIVVSDDIAKAKAFAEASFRLRKGLEEKQTPQSGKGGMFETAKDFATRNMIAGIVTTLILVATTVWCCFFRGDDGPRGPTEEEKRATRQKKRQEQEKAKDAKDKNDEGSEKKDDEAEETKQEPKEGEEEEQEEEDVEEKDEEVEEKEGGSGDLKSEDE